jgi:hypothetical protein
MLVEHRIDDMDESLIAGEKAMPSVRRYPSASLAQMLA